jgi:hypothetical protein
VIAKSLYQILEDMTDDEIINLAIKELKKSEKLYKMFSEFSFMKELDPKDSRFVKICYMLKRSVPFEKHTDDAIRLSAIGLNISNNYKDWFHYKKSLLPKKDYIKIGSFVITGLSLVWIVFQGVRNDNLKNENAILKKNYHSLMNQTIQLKDTVMKLKTKLNLERKNSHMEPIQNKK